VDSFAEIAGAVVAERGAGVDERDAVVSEVTMQVSRPSRTPAAGHRSSVVGSRR
jgi:hypothetical protein